MPKNLTDHGSALFMGIDVGTTGVRVATLDSQGNIVALSKRAMESPKLINHRPCQNPVIWWDTVSSALIQMAEELRSIGRSLEEVVSIAIDGTSGTMLLADSNLNPLTLGFMYNSSGFDQQANQIEPHAPADSIARGGGSGLARLLFLQTQTDVTGHLLHQADWIVANLIGRPGNSDETNALKTGYDVVSRRWPDWLESTGANMQCLPAVKPVGQAIGQVSQSVAQRFGFANDATVVAGTTDSNAAFLASGASKIGEGVTSLGTTLAIKLLSDRPVSDPSRGIYSHRIGDMWLPGGASNTGGGVLLNHFTPSQMKQMENQLNPLQPTGLDYYPLVEPGERFPVSDAAYPPRLEPRPESDVLFFQAMLEGISEIERIGYAALTELGTPKVNKVYTAGGGATNEAWSRIREGKLRVPVVPAPSMDASVGAAMIALRS